MPPFLFKLRTRLGNSFLGCVDLYVLLWAVPVGIAGALATFAFREGIELLQWMMTGQKGSVVEMAARLSWPLRIAVPAVGGVLAGGLLALSAGGEKRAGSRDYMEAVHAGDGRLSLRQTLLRSASSICTIATGGSIGREGAMVQLAALCASRTGIGLRLDPARLRLLVACGAAAGVSAAYSAPLAGAFFISEIVLRSIAMESFGPILVAAAAANIAMRMAPGYQAPYAIPAFPAVNGAEILPFVVLGLVAGLGAPLFLRFLRMSKRLFDRTQLPLPLRLGAGGLLLGLLSIASPQIWGNGYEVVSAILHEPWAWSALLGILVLKVFGTAATAGSGAVGGVFTPALFVGAVTGCLFGQAAQALWPQMASAPFAYAIVGMGAFLAAASQAPLMSMLMIYEMTLSYQLMLPLSLCCVLAYFVSRAAGDLGLYEISARHRQHDRELHRLRMATVERFVRPAQTVLPATATMHELASAFQRHGVRYVYIVDQNGCYLGAVALADIAGALLNRSGASAASAHDFLSRRLPVLTAQMPLRTALAKFRQHPGERLPVVQDGESPILLGVVDKTALLDAYSRFSALAVS